MSTRVPKYSSKINRNPFNHHTRLGRGLQCHADIAKDWNTSKGRRLVMHWLGMMELEVPAGYLGR